MTQDHTDVVQARWAALRPDLDVSSMGVVGRLKRLHRLLHGHLEETCNEFGLSLWAFEVLELLRHTGPPHQLPPTAIGRTLMVSPAAMTNRIDRLEAAGLVRRLPDPADRRGNLIDLTEEGASIVDAAVEAHLAKQAAVLAGLTPQERPVLEHLLRRLVLTLETPPPNGPARATQRVAPPTRRAARRSAEPAPS